MASANGFLSENQFRCTICLDVFTEPVSLPCGHNFCRACITRHWEGKEHLRQCPLCKETFGKGLKLRVNTGFRDVVDNFKKFRNQGPPKGEVVKPGEVPCDCCTGVKFKASKTCLECVASYCETHLEPHRRDATFKKHKLSEPVQIPEQDVCKKHKKMLALFCRTDQSRACVLCSEHSGHDIVSLEEEYAEKLSQLERKKTDVQEMIQERQKKVSEIKQAVGKKNKENHEAKANTAHAFTSLIVSTQIKMHGLVTAIEEKRREEERQAVRLVTELEKEIDGLQNRFTKLEKLSNSKSHVQLVKRFESITASPLPNTKDWSDVSISGQHCVEDIKRAVVELKDALAKETQRVSEEFEECCDPILAEETAVLKITGNIDLDALPEGLRLVIIRQWYAVDVKFDPCSASDVLCVSEDLKQVQAPYVIWLNNSTPQKFNKYAHILGKRCYGKGRFYYEVHVTRKSGWDLGVVRGSLRGMNKITLSPRNGAWILRLRNNTKLTALNNVNVNLSRTDKLEKVGVFVDCELRQVSFYDVDTATLLYSFTNCEFDGKICPFFSPGLPEGGLNGGPLVLTPCGAAPCGAAPCAAAPEGQILWEKTKELIGLIFTIIGLFFCWLWDKIRYYLE